MTGRVVTGGEPGGRSIQWGLYAASSWTWCIGMYLPVILLERAGWTAFWVFAIPNVLGCAALGFLFRSSEASRRFTERHRTAAALFSAVTIAYHLFFAAFLVTMLIPGEGRPASPEVLSAQGKSFAPIYGLLAAGALLAIGLVIARLPNRLWPTIGTICWLISIALFLTMLRDPLRLSDLTPRFGADHALLLAPVALFGFLLCPYLDLTFHRARQCSGSNQSSWFLGAGFATMLGVTVVAWFREVPLPGVLLLLHLSVQGCFTVGAHLREWREAGVNLTPGWRLASIAIIASGAAIALMLPSGPLRSAFPADTLYYWFLAAYGLFFPAYVLVFAVPRIRIPRTPRTLSLFALIVLLAAPLYEIGFVRERPEALIAPLIVAAAFIALRLAATSRSSTSPTTASS